MRKSRFIVAVVVVVAVACAPQQPPVADSAGSSATPADGHVPARLVEMLRSDGMSVEDVAFDGGLSADETLRRFHKEYGEPRSGGEPTPYAVKVTASPSPGLAPGSVVRMVHVPDVAEAFEGVAPPPGASDAAPDLPLADMFAFFDASTGRHIEATYIASGH